MKIPKHVNTVWDWVDDHIRLLAIIVALAAAAAAGLWLPILSAFVLGAALGGLAIHSRMSRRTTRLRAEVDDLLRENGSLRHENNMLIGGVISAQMLVTQRLPVITADPGEE
ncbi:MAG: hypothetical protein JWO67_4426 [Streptosporangiaceae bacterium]|nr:hypothetical protein [Streptosporangiaceae bacterium]